MACYDSRSWGFSACFVKKIGAFMACYHSKLDKTSITVLALASPHSATIPSCPPCALQRSGDIARRLSEILFFKTIFQKQDHSMKFLNFSRTLQVTRLEALYGSSNFSLSFPSRSATAIFFSPSVSPKSQSWVTFSFLSFPSLMLYMIAVERWIC